MHATLLILAVFLSIAWCNPFYSVAGTKLNLQYHEAPYFTCYRNQLCF